MNKLIWILCLGASLVACSSHLVLHQTAIVPISKDGTSVSETEQIIKPYRDSMSKVMNIHVGNSPVNFIMERPSSNLMNWVADALFTNQTKTIRLSQPVFCLLNFGGIRSTLNKGEILMGDMFKLMPFDNTITWVEIPVEVLPEIATLLLKTGGEPLSNAYLENGQLHVNGLNQNHTHVWIITSDYLANGGDNMLFFKKGTNYTKHTKTLRDALIEEAMFQGDLMETTDKRIR